MHIVVIYGEPSSKEEIMEAEKVSSVSEEISKTRSPPASDKRKVKIKVFNNNYYSCRNNSKYLEALIGYLEDKFNCLAGYQCMQMQ